METVTAAQQRRSAQPEAQLIETHVIFKIPVVAVLSMITHPEWRQTAVLLPANVSFADTTPHLRKTYHKFSDRRTTENWRHEMS